MAWPVTRGTETGVPAALPTARALAYGMSTRHPGICNPADSSQLAGDTKRRVDAGPASATLARRPPGVWPVCLPAAGSTMCRRVSCLGFVTRGGVLSC